MSYEILYNPNQFTPTEVWGTDNQKHVVDQQTIWQQVDDDRWLEVTLERGGAFGRRVYAREAMLRHEIRPDGSWAAARPINQGTLALVENSIVQRGSAPVPPKASDNAASAYIARSYSAEVPKAPDVAAIRSKLRMY